MDQLLFGRDVQGFNAYAPAFANYAYSVSLGNAGHATLTIPSTYENWIIVFTYVSGVEIWVSNGGTAAVPAGGTIASSVSELSPSARTVKAGDVLDVLNNGTAGNVGILLYAVS